MNQVGVMLQETGPEPDLTVTERLRLLIMAARGLAGLLIASRRFRWTPHSRHNTTPRSTP